MLLTQKYVHWIEEARSIISELTNKKLTLSKSDDFTFQAAAESNSDVNINSELNEILLLLFNSDLSEFVECVFIL